MSLVKTASGVFHFYRFRNGMDKLLVKIGLVIVSEKREKGTCPYPIFTTVYQCTTALKAYCSKDWCCKNRGIIKNRSKYIFERIV